METKDARDRESDRIFDLFRRWGYLAARLSPLGDLEPMDLPELSCDGEVADRARSIYCGSIGVEFMHIPDRARRLWIQERMEGEAPSPERARILDRLIRVETFEQVLHAGYPGTKRFSLEGMAALIPLLDEILNAAVDQGAVEAVLGMSHRGRLNVMVHTVGRPAVEIFTAFEDVDPRSVLGGGDVKYHVGATGVFQAGGGRTIEVRLVSNPSHLEAVDPVALGRVRAKQTRAGKDGPRLILPILIHGDAAFAGQGIAAETMNLSNVKGYSVGGALHVIADNRIGFTARPDEIHSSRFTSDMAKRLPIAIFHVNGEDPDAVVRVARLAVEYRYAFQSSVVVDLIGYRRHGHSEVDDPTITQPLLYRRIKDHPPLWKSYAEAIGADPRPAVESVRAEYAAARDTASSMEKNPRLTSLPDYWSGYEGGPYDPAREVETGVAVETLAAIAESLAGVPEDFAVHPKVKRLLERRRAMGNGQVPVDFGTAELLAFGTLLKEGIPIRMSGQDSRRGTFGQRNAILIDVETEEELSPLSLLAPDQPAAFFEIWNSILSEAAVVGFEYGMSRDYPEALVLWEAQFGDFANGAQVIIDQFISSGEDKWGLLSGLVMLLPHGYEGQGPEHSSGRIERFLTLAAEDNLQICQPSTAAQHFHLLRRQALRSWRKPLIVFTPKSMLRHSDAASPLEEFARPRFLPVVPESRIEGASRILICTGKIGHELRAARKNRGDTTTAIVLLEQLYPFPEEDLAEEIARQEGAREIVWVQEEPGNMGALFYVLPRLERLAGGRPVRSVKRSASAGVATGSAKAHDLEQRTLIALAFPR